MRSRRDFIKGAAGLAAIAAHSGGAAAPSRPRIPLGIDNFSVRAFGWKAGDLIDYAASLGVDVLLLSDLDAYESHEPGHLGDLRKRASDLGIQLQAGSFSICPTSKNLTTKFGTVEEHLALLLRVAKAIGSPVARCVLGSFEDRLGPGGIAPHVESTVGVLKAVRPIAEDSGVKIAIENHAGDMTAPELVGLIQRAGPGHVGATMDCGNATWAMEDPLRNLERLGPYAATTGMRDSMVWETPEGAIVQWTAIGDGCVDFKTYIDRFAALCPGVAFVLETISGFPKKFPFRDPSFMAAYANVPATEIERFAALARKGTPIEPRKRPAGPDKKIADQAYQKEQLERSVRYCKEVLGMGLRTPPARA